MDGMFRGHSEPNGAHFGAPQQVRRGWEAGSARRARDSANSGVEIVEVQSLVIFLVIGAVAGWIAGLLMRGGGFGLLGNIVVGIIGALIGGFLFGLLGISAGGLAGSLVTAVVGAAVLLFLVGLFKKA
jgi:uncharacterized membrane protein YeaQ/YmgE (transglycosylase-associated protein family)